MPVQVIPINSVFGSVVIPAGQVKVAGASASPNQPASMAVNPIVDFAAQADAGLVEADIRELPQVLFVVDKVVTKARFRLAVTSIDLAVIMAVV